MEVEISAKVKNPRYLQKKTMEISFLRLLSLVL